MIPGMNYLTLSPDDEISLKAWQEPDGTWKAFPVVNGVDRHELTETCLISQRSRPGFIQAGVTVKTA